MKQGNRFEGWHLFRIASISTEALDAAQSDDRTNPYCFLAKIDSFDAYESKGPEEDEFRSVVTRKFDEESSERIAVASPDEPEDFQPEAAFPIDLTFNAYAEVKEDGFAHLHLSLDDENWDEAVRRASYIRGSGPRRLFFGHRVTPGDVLPGSTN